MPQRRKRLEQEINRLGIEAKYWDAIVLPNVVQAISLSHKKIIQWAKDNNLEEVAIAEDDIEFTSLNSYKYFIENKPDDYDIFLGNYYSGVLLPDKTLHGFSGFTLFMCHSRYYDKFLETPVTKNIDAAQRGKGRFVVCSPEVAKQISGYSFHRKKIVDDDHYLKDRVFLTD